MDGRLAPATPLGSSPTSNIDQRSFVIKFDPDGAVIFAVLVGGSAVSNAQAIALTARGQIRISGSSAGAGFPSTAGAYDVADSQWS